MNLKQGEPAWPHRKHVAVSDLTIADNIYYPDRGDRKGKKPSLHRLRGPARTTRRCPIVPATKNVFYRPQGRDRVSTQVSLLRKVGPGHDRQDHLSRVRLACMKVRFENPCSWLECPACGCAGTASNPARRRASPAVSRRFPRRPAVISVWPAATPTIRPGRSVPGRFVPGRSARNSVLPIFPQTGAAPCGRAETAFRPRSVRMGSGGGAAPTPPAGC